jgi:hypothetical protein
MCGLGRRCRQAVREEREEEDAKNGPWMGARRLPCAEAYHVASGAYIRDEEAEGRRVMGGQLRAVSCRREVKRVWAGRRGEWNFGRARYERPISKCRVVFCPTIARQVLLMFWLSGPPPVNVGSRVAVFASFSLHRRWPAVRRLELAQMLAR